MRLSLIAVAILALGVGAGAAELKPQDELLAAINTFRLSQGLRPLVRSGALERAAKDHSADLARWGQLDHRGSDGADLRERLTRAGYAFSLAAENLAYGQTTAQETLAHWLQSPGHRRNLLLEDVREAGVGYARRARAANEISAPYWTLLLAEPQD
jgi:uncharacterized protein YkwD